MLKVAPLELAIGVVERGQGNVVAVLVTFTAYKKSSSGRSVRIHRHEKRAAGPECSMLRTIETSATRLRPYQTPASKAFNIAAAAPQQVRD
jgi:hypothetical protein